MTRFILLFMLLLSATAMRADEYTYDINYKWGFIDKSAGHGSVITYDDGSNFYATLSGQSIPMGGRIYMVSDTLRATYSSQNGLPAQTTDFVVGFYTKPYASGFVEEMNDDFCGYSQNYRTTDGRGTLSASSSTMEAVSITADMLGLFKIAQMIDFNCLAPGSYTIPITNPQGASTPLYIQYEGPSEINGCPTFEISFRYTYEGEPSGYPVNCHIRQADRIPVFFSAGLPIGHLEMSLTD